MTRTEPYYAPADRYYWALNTGGGYEVRDKTFRDSVVSVEPTAEAADTTIARWVAIRMRGEEAERYQAKLQAEIAERIEAQRRAPLSAEEKLMLCGAAAGLAAICGGVWALASWLGDGLTTVVMDAVIALALGSAVVSGVGMALVTLAMVACGVAALGYVAVRLVRGAWRAGV